MLYNYYLKLITIVFLVISLVGCTNMNREIYIQTKNDYTTLLQNSNEDLVINNDWTLFILGEKTNIPVFIAEDYNNTFECAPILPVLNYLGIKIVDKNGVYELKGSREKLYINFDEQTIQAKNSDFNLLQLATGGKIYYEFVGADVITSTPVLSGILFSLDLDLVCHINKSDKKIEIKNIT